MGDPTIIWTLGKFAWLNEVFDGSIYAGNYVLTFQHIIWRLHLYHLEYVD